MISAIYITIAVLVFVLMWYLRDKTNYKYSTYFIYCVSMFWVFLACFIVCSLIFAIPYYAVNSLFKMVDAK